MGDKQHNISITLGCQAKMNNTVITMKLLIGLHSNIISVENVTNDVAKTILCRCSIFAGLLYIIVYLQFVCVIK